MKEDVALEAKRDRLLVRRGRAEVFAGEVRNLVKLLAEGMVRLVHWVDPKSASESREGPALDAEALTVGQCLV